MPSSLSLLDHFPALEDPRQHWRVVYPLPEILLLVLCATLSGMDDFVETRLWDEQRLDFLRRFLPYERGLPAHDPLNDVVNALDADLFQACSSSLDQTLREAEPDLIAIDGKTSRRCQARTKGRAALHTVSARVSRQRLVLGQKALPDRAARSPPSRACRVVGLGREALARIEREQPDLSLKLQRFLILELADKVADTNRLLETESR